MFLLMRRLGFFRSQAEEIGFLTPNKQTHVLTCASPAQLRGLESLLGMCWCGICTWDLPRTWLLCQLLPCLELSLQMWRDRRVEAMPCVASVV